MLDLMRQDKSEFARLRQQAGGQDDMPPKQPARRERHVDRVGNPDVGSPGPSPEIAPVNRFAHARHGPQGAQNVISRPKRQEASQSRRPWHIPIQDI